MWYSVRHLIVQDQSYEERITLWKAGSFDEAIELARHEAEEYASLSTAWKVGDLFQAFELEGHPSSGREIFSLIRMSELGADSYMKKFFATGNELEKSL